MIIRYRNVQRTPVQFSLVDLWSVGVKLLIKKQMTVGVSCRWINLSLSIETSPKLSISRIVIITTYLYNITLVSWMIQTARVIVLFSSNLCSMAAALSFLYVFFSCFSSSFRTLDFFFLMNFSNCACYCNFLWKTPREKKRLEAIHTDLHRCVLAHAESCTVCKELVSYRLFNTGSRILQYEFSVS